MALISQSTGIVTSARKIFAIIDGGGQSCFSTVLSLPSFVS